MHETINWLRSIEIKDDNDKPIFIDGLKKVNIFIGENNSGKSKIMRKIMIESLNYYNNNWGSFIDPKENKISFYNSETLRKSLLDIKSKIIEFYKTQSLHGQTFSTIKLKDMPNNLDFVLNEIETKINENEFFYSFNDIVGMIFTINKLRQVDITSGSDNLFEKLRKMTSFINELMQRKVFKINDVKYIPVLRNLRVELSNGRDIFKEVISNQYFKGDSRSIEIITGIQFYSAIRKLLLGNQDDRDIIRNYENFLSAYYFNKETISIIPRENTERKEEEVLHIKIGKYSDAKIHNLGEGLQSIILFTYPCFVNAGVSLFIDEPELYLHPGLQRKFIKNIIELKEMRNHQFFFTTHSNHLIELLMEYPDDVSVYLVEKVDNDKNTTPSIKVTNVTERDRSVLDAIGVRDSSLFYSNAKIWVEGITDRLYLRAYLELYFKKHPDKKLFEDMHYSFIEYAGGNLTHFSFDGTSEEKIDVSRFTQNNIVIVDGDSENKERTIKLKKILNDNLIVTGGKEIENTLSEKIIFYTLMKYSSPGKLLVNSETEFMSLIDVKYQSDKQNSIAEYFENGKKVVKNFKSERTIRDKIGFCRKAISVIEETDYDELSDDAKRITKKLVDFIENANKN